MLTSSFGYKYGSILPATLLVALLSYSPIGESFTPNYETGSALWWVYDSLSLIDEMYFQCGDSNFKFENFPLGDKLFIEFKSDWIELEIVGKRGTEIIFDGPGRTGGALEKNVDLPFDVPIFNKTKRSLVWVEASTRDYLIRQKNDAYIPYRYTLDFYTSKIESKNLKPITDTYIFDSEKYRKEQSLKLNWPLYSDFDQQTVFVKTVIFESDNSLNPPAIGIEEAISLVQKEIERVKKNESTKFSTIDLLEGSDSLAALERDLETLERVLPLEKEFESKQKHDREIQERETRARNKIISETIGKLSDPVLITTKRFKDRDYNYCFPK